MDAVAAPAAFRARATAPPAEEPTMNIRTWSMIVPLVLMTALAPSSKAATGVFATEDAAQQSCGSDEVVWVDLDRGRYYHKTQSDYGKSGNGGYSCSRTAKLQYREAR
jgi:hypothetical protein